MFWVGCTASWKHTILNEQHGLITAKAKQTVWGVMLLDTRKLKVFLGKDWWNTWTFVQVSICWVPTIPPRYCSMIWKTQTSNIDTVPPVEFAIIYYGDYQSGQHGPRLGSRRASLQLSCWNAGPRMGFHTSAALLWIYSQKDTLLCQKARAFLGFLIIFLISCINLWSCPRCQYYWH